MYHVIASPPADAPYPELYVTPARFAEEMAFLARHGYEAVTLQQVWNYWHGGDRLPRKPFVLSLDDGFPNWYTAAYPILQRYGWVGTMNIAVTHVGGKWLPRLVAAGWELDSHTLTHQDLTLLSGSDLRREVAGSRARLRKLFGVPVNFFCYPSGRYNDAVVTEVRRAGYLGATTTNEGFGVPSKLFVLPRVRVNGSDTPRTLGAKLTTS
jgi:peptidoglycan/xylan/chitin deacetylase (PgdA/CDA1 family)